MRDVSTGGGGNFRELYFVSTRFCEARYLLQVCFRRNAITYLPSAVNLHDYFVHITSNMRDGSFKRGDPTGLSCISHCGFPAVLRTGFLPVRVVASARAFLLTLCGADAARPELPAIPAAPAAP